MASTRDPRLTAEKVLSKTLGVPVRLPEAKRLKTTVFSRTTRFKVQEDAPEIPSSIIVKQALPNKGEAYDPVSSSFGPAWRLFNEWAGLQFLGQIADDPPLAPRLYAGSREDGLIIMEDLGTSVSHDKLLLGDDPKVAEQMLVGYMSVLGQLHAVSAGKRECYAHLREALGPTLPYFSTAAVGRLEPRQIHEVFLTIAELLKIKPVAGTSDALEKVSCFWTNPGPFFVYTQQDQNLDNCIRVGSELRLLDLEFGGFSHALIDGSYARVPSGWNTNRFPPHVVQKMEAAYRKELAQGCPEAEDDRMFHQALTEACAYWIIGALKWAMPNVLERDRKWGISTDRQHVMLRLDALAETAEEFGHLEPIGETARKMVIRLRRLWPPEVHDMPYYPVFR